MVVLETLKFGKSGNKESCDGQMCKYEKNVPTEDQQKYPVFNSKVLFISITFLFKTNQNFIKLIKSGSKEMQKSINYFYKKSCILSIHQGIQKKYVSLFPQ